MGAWEDGLARAAAVPERRGKYARRPVKRAHGTISSYRRGCCCKDCRRAKRDTRPICLSGERNQLWRAEQYAAALERAGPELRVLIEAQRRDDACRRVWLLTLSDDLAVDFEWRSCRRDVSEWDDPTADAALGRLEAA